MEDGCLRPTAQRPTWVSRETVPTAARRVARAHAGAETTRAGYVGSWPGRGEIAAARAAGTEVGGVTNVGPWEMANGLALGSAGKNGNQKVVRSRLSSPSPIFFLKKKLGQIHILKQGVSTRVNSRMTPDEGGNDVHSFPTELESIIYLLLSHPSSTPPLLLLVFPRILS